MQATESKNTSKGKLEIISNEDKKHKPHLVFKR